MMILIIRFYLDCFSIRHLDYTSISTLGYLRAAVPYAFVIPQKLIGNLTQQLRLTGQVSGAEIELQKAIENGDFDSIDSRDTEARMLQQPHVNISFTVNVHFDNKDFKDLTMVRKLLMIVQGNYSILRKANGLDNFEKDSGLDISGCCEPNTLMNYLQEAGNKAHLVYWQECATNSCLNTSYHQFAIGLGDYKDKARRVESPSFVNYSDNKGNGYNDKSQPCATYMRPSPPRDKPYANKAGICSCCIM
ncbi:hypothetical protein Tco_0720750 [Tanacetum coccineum]